MKYKYEFEVNNDDFEKGCCSDCPLSYVDYSDDFNICCVLHARWDECPLKKVEDNEENLKLCNVDNIFRLLRKSSWEDDNSGARKLWLNNTIEIIKDNIPKR
jgi:hypothetical protein